jgi:hypothetical protein
VGQRSGSGRAPLLIFLSPCDTPERPPCGRFLCPAGSVHSCSVNAEIRKPQLLAINRISLRDFLTSILAFHKYLRDCIVHAAIVFDIRHLLRLSMKYASYCIAVLLLNS